ncbi:hypothetical protein ACX16M_29735 [Bacillus cereus]|nr:hypothetical protein [Bacillus cereus]MDA2286694.1 hypothetical protein [Bacillus cereus]MDA2297627.1 hypothetical protein [Bacillus cereus]MDA2694452.1 hypothetical protein [Bacillus cereus]MDA2700097.1 hypothetical protein [Bacillus cereus]
MIENDLEVINKSDELRKFLINNFHALEMDGASGSNLSFPNFDLFARDYLLFAEHELKQLQKNETIIEHIHLINCVSHLRRAIDCQLDTCFEALKIKVFKKKNLSLETKLKFFEDAGVFNSLSLARLNKIRNSMEHGYRIPEIKDIETYFDLVSAFISILESMLSLLTTFSEVNLTIDNIDNKIYFSIWYLFDDKPCISYQITDREKNISKGDQDDSNLYFKYDISNLNDLPEVSKEVTVTVDDRLDFPYFFKVLLLLARKGSFVSDKFIFEELTK